jgi:hypothetical protein
VSADGWTIEVRFGVAGNPDNSGRCVVSASKGSKTLSLLSSLGAPCFFAQDGRGSARTVAQPDVAVTVAIIMGSPIPPPQQYDINCPDDYRASEIQAILVGVDEVRLADAHEYSLLCSGAPLNEADYWLAAHSDSEKATSQ